MTLAETTVTFEGKRVAVKDEHGEWHMGKFSYVTETMFPGFGIIAYFGRNPIYNIVIDSIFECNDLLTFREIQEETVD